MKRFCILTLLTALLSLMAVQESKAQVNVNINVGAQPRWGPVGYNVVEYYYLPDLETYYYVPSRQFIYLNNGKWIYSNALPVRYRSYDLYSGYKVVVNEPKPYLHHTVYKTKYAKFKGVHGKQVVIRDSRSEANPGKAKGHHKGHKRK